jgi:hydroxymethylglutaryl-CoA lyase
MKTQLPHIETGAHFHALPHQWLPKIQAAYENGCRRFDGAILGFGGCPMAADELTGNIPTEEMVQWLNGMENTGLHMEALKTAVAVAPGIYG